VEIMNLESCNQSVPPKESLIRIGKSREVLLYHKDINDFRNNIKH
jgi:hypothetical protein